MNSAKFYDDFLSYQVRSGINDRIFHLYRKVVQYGLKKNSSVLEVGCGIGALTFLLTQKVKSGPIEAFDISSNSIGFAREKVKAANVTFFVSGVLQYNPTQELFDRILLFDVLEHIPEDDHAAVLKRLCDWLEQDGLVLINLPNPAYIEYDQQLNASTLQELDQPIYLQNLLPKIIEAGLELVHFNVYSVWVKDDYHFLILRRKKVFTEELISRKRSMIAKAVVRMKRELRSWRYRYP